MDKILVSWLLVEENSDTTWPCKACDGEVFLANVYGKTIHFAREESFFWMFWIHGSSIAMWGHGNFVTPVIKKAPELR